MAVPKAWSRLRCSAFATDTQAVSTEESLPDDVKRFVLTSISSVPYLEAILLLRREPARVFDEQALARALGNVERTAAELLERLCAAGVAAAEGAGGRYAPRDERLAQALDRLAAYYATHLIDVTRLIHDATRKSAHRFADAFKLRKDP